MAALSEDATAGLSRRIAELEQRLETALIERDAAIERQAASGLINFRLQEELRSAQECQNASNEILRAIAETHGDAAHALQRIAETTQHVFNAAAVTIRIAQDDEWVQTIRIGASAQLTGEQPAARLMTRGANLPATVYLDNRQIHIPDLDTIDPSMAAWPASAARAAGIRTICGTPLRREGNAIGAMIVYRDQFAAFTDEELALQQSFADQAVIAIENARLFNETQEALARQTATADILEVIASSPSNVQPVFEAIAASANRLMHAHATTVWRSIEGMVHLAAFTPVNPVADEALRSRSSFPRSSSAYWHLIQEGHPAQFVDTENVSPLMRELGRARGFRSLLVVPLMSEGVAIGTINVTRATPGSFAKADVQLLRTFADQAVIAIENARLFNETREALERQTATADILKVIASSPSDVQPVFEAIVHSAARLFEPCAATITTLKDGKLHWNATVQLQSDFDVERVKAVYPFPFDPVRSPSSIAILERRIIEIPDTAAPDTPEYTVKAAAAGGFRSITFVPLVSQSNGIGTIILTHPQPGFRLTEKQLALVQTFSDQAVIAIENTRLFNEVQARTLELTEALEQQTATSEVLGVISSSAGDLAPVFDAMLGKAMQLCGANFGVLSTFDGSRVHTAATYGLPPAYEEYRRDRTLEYGPGTGLYRLMQGEAFVEIEDLVDSEPYRRGDTNRRALVEIGRARCLLTVPLLKDDRIVGFVMIFRQEKRRFSQKQITLLQQFASQAVIAIENTRLLRELRARTDDLSESLQQQTATSEVLQIISSSPGELAPVFDKMLENATRVCGGGFGSMVLVDGDTLRQAAFYNAPLELAAVRTNQVRQVHPPSSIATAVRDKRVVQIEDIRNSPAYLARAQHAVELAELGGARTIVVVPMVRDDQAIGVITVYRQEVRPFSDKQIELLTNFARQAVIAIENARLLRELRQRTDDLTEALTYQTGSANILKVIASSPTDVKPVLQAIVESACELCEATDAVVVLKDGESLVFAAHHGPIPVLLERRAISRAFAAGRAIVDRVPVHVHDVLSDEGDEFPEAQELSAVQGIRSVLSVPLMRDAESIGAILLRRTEVHPFSDKQITLLRTFADQAVIAIGNVRLFEEVQARTRDLTESLQQQTATADVLKVISRSAFDLQVVLDTLVESAGRLCEADEGTIFQPRDGVYRLAAHCGLPPEKQAFLSSHPFMPGRETTIGRVLLDGRTMHIHDIHSDAEYRLPEDPNPVGTRLGVPLLREGAPIGVFVLTRQQSRPFSDKQIELVQTFADQAVIAIENVRLFDQVQARTQELSKSIDDLRTAQGRLIQTEKLASLGQLTAGIAHEIKNPLNFVNNFAALSVELTDELNDMLKQAEIAGKSRNEVAELIGTLKENLSRIVQHGKRADSIVKNMLLHSREGSGEHRPTDVNALVEESLNLAYHGARAEKPQFNVTLRRDFDPEAGMIEAFPQEITRVFLNLLSNAFYAVTKRKAEIGEPFEPVVRATTRDRTDRVEIWIRDNGTGIPAEARERMFNPFFTTKPAGEGTGLGLSMSHDIIVKQHGGTIDVDTMPGEYTEFKIVLPRTRNHSNKARGRT